MCLITAVENKLPFIRLNQKKEIKSDNDITVYNYNLLLKMIYERRYKLHIYYI